MKTLSIVLLVNHLTAGGVWVEAPPSNMGSMWECKQAKAEVEKGFRGDAVPDEDFKVECKKIESDGYDRT